MKSRYFTLMFPLLLIGILAAGCGSPAATPTATTSSDASVGAAAVGGAGASSAPDSSSTASTAAGATSGFQPDGPVNFVVHTGPGGGSDVFARAVADLLMDEQLIQQNWPVRNEQGGSGAKALAYMKGIAGQNDTIAAMTPTWLVTPLTNQEAAATTVADLTPIAQLALEPQVMAVKADAPYNTIQEFIDAAKQQPGKLIQSGGSPTAVDALAAEIIKAKTGANWSFLAFEGGGERIAAVLGGNANVIISGAAEIGEQVRANQLKVIATIGPERTTLFPDAPTLPESGIDVEIPQQFRGIVGPPNMSADAVAYYQGIMEKLTQTSAWKKYADENGLTTSFVPSEQFGQFLTTQNQALEQILTQLNLRGQ